LHGIGYSNINAGKAGGKLLRKYGAETMRQIQPEEGRQGGKTKRGHKNELSVDFKKVGERRWKRFDR